VNSTGFNNSLTEPGSVQSIKHIMDYLERRVHLNSFKICDKTGRRTYFF